jgi:1,4-dihydroxy-2-naphthoate octaprenyltransferase
VVAARRRGRAPGGGDIHGRAEAVRLRGARRHETVPGAAWLGALAVGLPACGILLANNIRDVAGDRATGKRTLAVRIGVGRAQAMYVACIVGALVAVVGIGLLEPFALLALLAAPLAIAPVRHVRANAGPPSLIAALIGTARFQLVLSALLAVGLWLA